MVDLDRVRVLIRVAIWASVFAIFVELGFGLVYLIISVILFIFLSTGTNDKIKGRLSAYSVFNPNMEEIQGTLNAKKMLKSMHLGSRN